jgi:DNA repair protein RecO
MPLVRDDAICLRVWDWSETSQTVSLFARGMGLVRGVAKGAKRDQSAFAGGFELATRGEVVLSDRAKEKATGSMATIAAWDLSEVFPATRATLVSFHGVMAMLDLVHHAVHEYDPHPLVFEALLTSLRDAGTPRTDRAALLRVAWSVLADTGHTPELLLDVRTEKALAPAASYHFLPRGGGFSAATSQASDLATVWKVRGETLQMLRVMAHEPGKDALAAFDDATLWRGAKLLMLHAREVFQSATPAVDALIGVVEGPMGNGAATPGSAARP